jgi:hypothetical protein
MENFMEFIYLAMMVFTCTTLGTMLVAKYTGARPENAGVVFKSMMFAQIAIVGVTSLTFIILNVIQIIS